MTNQEWLATLTKEECWETLDWLLHDYGKRYIDTRLAVMEWLGAAHDSQKKATMENERRDNMTTEQIAEIFNRINDALEDTGYQAVGFDNTGSMLEIMIDENGGEK